MFNIQYNHIINKNRKSLSKIKVNINSLDSINTILNLRFIINLIDFVLIRKLNLFINLIQIIIININIDFLNLKGIYRNIYIILKRISNIINIFIIKNIYNKLLLNIL